LQGRSADRCVWLPGGTQADSAQRFRSMRCVFLQVATTAAPPSIQGSPFRRIRIVATSRSDARDDQPAIHA
jgi:hypothetical protein